MAKQEEEALYLICVFLLFYKSEVMLISVLIGKWREWLDSHRGTGVAEVEFNYNLRGVTKWALEKREDRDKGLEI